jgi:hypothetical protein
MMEEEVRQVVGERSAPNPDRQASRWGKERGYCVIDLLSRPSSQILTTTPQPLVRPDRLQ